MAQIEELRVLLRLKDEATSGMNRAGQSINRLAGQARKAGLILTGVGAGFAALGFKAIQAASDVEEMRSKFNVVFGSLSDDVADWADTTAAAVNRSRFDIMKWASTLQDTFVPMGFAREEAAKMSKQVTELAIDVGSFNNVASGDVIRDFQSALVGNTETVRKYGIVITEARLKQEIINSGWAESADEITEAMKIQARMNLILAGTTDAQGDAIRTADSFANQMQGLKASFNDVVVEIGSALMPMASRLVGTLTRLVKTVLEASPTVKKWAVIIGLGAAAVLGLGVALTAIGFILPALTAGLAAFGVVLALVTSPITLIVAGAAAIIFGLVKLQSALGTTSHHWSEGWRIILDAMASAAGFIGDVLERIANNIIGTLNFVINQANRLPWVDIAPLDKIELDFKTSFNNIRETVTSAVGSTVDAAKSGFEGLQGVIGEVTSNMEETANTAAAAIQSAQEVQGEAMGALKDDTNAATDAFKDFAKTVQDSIDESIEFGRAWRAQIEKLDALLSMPLGRAPGRGRITQAEVGELGPDTDIQAMIRNVFRLVAASASQFEKGVQIPEAIVRAVANLTRQEFEAVLRNLLSRGAEVIGLQHGGIVNRPTLAMVGERGPEAVLPLGRGGGLAPTIHIDIHDNVVADESTLQFAVERALKAAHRNGDLEFLRR